MLLHSEDDKHTDLGHFPTLYIAMVQFSHIRLTRAVPLLISFICGASVNKCYLHAVPLQTNIICRTTANRCYFLCHCSDMSGLALFSITYINVPKWFFHFYHSFILNHLVIHLADFMETCLTFLICGSISPKLL